MALRREYQQGIPDQRDQERSIAHRLYERTEPSAARGAESQHQPGPRRKPGALWGNHEQKRNARVPGSAANQLLRCERYESSSSTDLPMKPASKKLTRLLLAWVDGDAAALDELSRAVDVELRRLARRYMRYERPGHTLQTTALVNEAYLRLIDWENVQWKNRTHFFAVAAQMMRRILVAHARSRQNRKRGGDWYRISIEQAALVADGKSPNLLALDDALHMLESIDERKCQVVELRFFAGLSAEETAIALGVSTDTVLNDWRMAKAWLLRELMAEARHAN